MAAMSVLLGYWIFRVRYWIFSRRAGSRECGTDIGYYFLSSLGHWTFPVEGGALPPPGFWRVHLNCEKYAIYLKLIHFYLTYIETRCIIKFKVNKLLKRKAV
jgi:hypothetical protein